MRLSPDTARTIAATVLGHDPGTLTVAESASHHVFLGADVVVKLIDATGHSRLDREIALAPHLPTGLTAPLLAGGLHEGVRYACYARAAGTAPGLGLPGVDAATALTLAEQAVERLRSLHTWTPAVDAARTLADVTDDGGFTGRAALVADVKAADVPGQVLDGLRVIADRAPPHVRTAVPVHADCHWGNWLAHDGTVTALLDFEWARFGDPLDDWFFLARFSGPHLNAVLDVIAKATGLSQDVLRAECEVREAAYLLSDLRTAGTLRDLHDLVVGRLWWRTSGPGASGR
jgi:aminoglycoside phosphotransferase (APT) family kinase protein